MEKNWHFQFRNGQKLLHYKMTFRAIFQPTEAWDARHGLFLQSNRCSITAIVLTTYVVKKSHHEELCFFVILQFLLFFLFFNVFAVFLPLFDRSQASFGYINPFYSSRTLIWAQAQLFSSIHSGDISKTMASIA